MNTFVISADGTNQAHTKALADLHTRYLPDSPLSELGKFFLQFFYYRRLLSSGVIQCDLVFSKGQYVSFSSYTDRPWTFMEEGIRRFRLRLYIVLFISIVMKPSRIKTIIKCMKRNNDRTGDDFVGESLSFGGSVNVRELFERTINHFKGIGYQRIRMVIRKDNFSSILFFQSFGAKRAGLEDGKYVYEIQL